MSRRRRVQRAGCRCGGSPLRGPAAARLPARGSLGGRGSLYLVERHARVYRHTWLVLVSGVVEPLFYLLSIGVGLGQLVGQVHLPGGQPVGYAEFVAPALLASAAMNGALFDSTFNVFFRLKYDKLYDAALATPMRSGDVALGEISWALLRGALYAVAFLVVMAAMGLVAVVVGAGRAARRRAHRVRFRRGRAWPAPPTCGAGRTSSSSSWPRCRCSCSRPRSTRSACTRGRSRSWSRCTPLYQSVDLLRGLTLGLVGPGLLWHVLYLAVLGLAGLLVAGRRIGRLLLT